jgi:hypothetical protein
MRAGLARNVTDYSGSTVRAEEEDRFIFIGVSSAAHRELNGALQVVLDRQNKPFAAEVSKVFRTTARFIARIVDDGKARGVMNTQVDSLTTAHLILGMLTGASQQASTSLARSLP